MSNNLNQKLEQFFQEAQMKDMFRMFNGLTERCFHGCVNDFTSRNLTQKEELCIYHCADKWMRYSAKMTKVMNELNMSFNNEPQGNNPFLQQPPSTTTK